MPFRATFACLWCGSAHTVRGPDDVEGWAQLCPDCVGKAGDNGFLRFRLRQALTERGAATRSATAVGPEAPAPDPDDMVAYYEARAPEYDDWYLRRGRYERGAIHDTAWATELDAAARWLDSLDWHGRIAELAAGTGWWSPLLAARGELSIYDAASAPLDLARERLVAHRLRAHIHVRDAWAEPVQAVDGLFTGFWLSHVERDRLGDFLALARRWLRPGGRFAFIDSLSDPMSGATDHPTPAADRSVRRLDDGREFTITKVFHQPTDLAATLAGAGFTDVSVTTTGRFFLMGTARAG
jgi:demethylmenaquinone methyltransferase/2-methoxy-6-polyprenyl-1,4-benzoquinol methylase